MTDTVLPGFASSLRHELHELAQPMAILQCRLELGMMTPGEAPLREAVTGALGDLRAMTDMLQTLRELSLTLGGKAER